MKPRLEGIETFVQAVEAGSFAGAAGRLRQTRSAVGKSIARLERRLGTRLFQRTTRQQSLTESGQLFYERCKRALAELEAAESALEAGRHEPVGQLRVTAPVVFGRHCVAPVMTRLAQRHPRLAVEVCLFDRRVDLIEEGFDLAVRIGALANSSSLAARRLGAQQFVLCAAPAYLEARGRPSSFEQFAVHAGISYAGRGAESAWQLRDASGQMRELPIERRLRFDDLQAIADAAIAGAGLARLPRWLAEPYVRRGSLEILLGNASVLETDIHAVWPQTRFLPSKTRAAIDALVEAVPAMSIAATDQSSSPS